MIKFRDESLFLVTTRGYANGDLDIRFRYNNGK